MDLTNFGVESEKSAMDCASQPGTLAGYAKPHRPTLTEKLEQQVAYKKDELARLEEALAELKANPQMERLFNLLQRV